MEALLVAAAIAAVVVTLVGVAYQRFGLAADLRRLGPVGQLVDIGHGRRLHARCAGEGGPAVLLESGIAASSLSWTLVQPRVAEFTRVCSYDRAGLGWSDRSGPRVTVFENADVALAMLRALRIPPPYVLVGHSYGALIVRAFAARHPDLVAGIVLVDPVAPSSWDPPPPRDLRRLRGGVFLSHVGGWLARVGFVRFCLTRLATGSTAVPRRASRLFGSEAAGVLDHLVGEVQKLPPETWPSIRALWCQPKCFTGMARHLAGLPASAAAVNACGGLGDIPLVVISAGRQPEASRAEHERMAALSSRGRHVIAEHSGHWIHLDDPGIVASAIKEIVSGIRILELA